METLPIGSKEMCLTCLLESAARLMPICGGESDLTREIEECAGIKIPQDADYPDKICKNCYAFLKIAQKFRITCQRSLEKLQKILKKSEEEDEGEKFVDIKIEKYDVFENVLLDNNSVTEDVFVKLEDDGYSDDLEDILDLANNGDSEPKGKHTKSRKSNKYATISTQKQRDQHKNKEITEEPKKRGRKQKTKPLEILEDNFKVVDQFNNNQRVRISEIKPPKIKESLICHHCGNKYPNKQKLHAHLKQHQPVKERVNVCEICAKRFITARHLQIHMNSHTGNRPYKCKYCSSAFGDPSSLVKHQHVHENIRPYKCNICEKTFTYSFALSKHHRVHTGEKPYDCIYCDKRFTQQHHKKAHEATHVKHMEREKNSTLITNSNN